MKDFGATAIACTPSYLLHIAETLEADDDIKNIMEVNLLPTNQYTSWAPFYAVINNCNQVIKYAPDVLNEDPDFTEGDWNVVHGEMLAVRALCHFYLVRTFRDVPLMTEARVDDSQDLYQTQAICTPQRIWCFLQVIILLIIALTIRIWVVLQKMQCVQ